MTTENPEVAAQLAGMREMVRSLDGAIREFSRQTLAVAERMRDQQEIGALFLLYRDGVLYRRGKDALPRAEAEARLRAALDGYEPVRLDDLAAFARWLREQPQLADRA